MFVGHDISSNRKYIAIKYNIYKTLNTLLKIEVISKAL